jgi:hypothetical protein
MGLKSSHIRILRNLWRRCSNVLSLFLCLALTSCAGGGAGNGSSLPVNYTIGGTVSGLSGTGLVLQDNGGDNLTISASGSFTFNTAITNGSTFNVTVLTQPSSPAQTCGVTNGSGTVSANVTSVQVTCTTNTYTIGGTVSGLSGTGLVLQDNGGNNLTVSGNGSFTFTAALATGTAYSVTVFSQPSNPAQTCGITAGGSGTVASANVTSVVVACTTIYTIGGTVSGLSGTGLVLQDNGGNDLSISANGSFTFNTAITNGSTFNVTVLTQPSSPAQTCGVTNGSGTASANITSVVVACITLPNDGAVSPLDYGGIADAVTISPVDLSGGGSTLVSAGLFTPDLVGKVVVCLSSNGNQDGLNLTTVTGYTDSSHIMVAGTIVRASANHSCAFASQNFRTALLAAQAVVPVNGTLQLPCGTMLISGGQILSTSQFTAAPSGPLSISGCPGKGTHFIMDWATMSTTTMPAVSLIGLSNYTSNLVFDSIGSGTFQAGASSLNAVINISGHVEDLEVDRWLAIGGSGTQACFTSAQDGSTWHNIVSAGCNVGLHLFNRGSSFVQDGVDLVRGATASIIVEGQEDGDVIIGGAYTGPIQVFSNAGHPTTITFLGVIVDGPAGAAALQIRNSTGPLNVNWVGGRIGCAGNAVCALNSSGVSIGTNVYFRASQTRIDSSGTGSGIINSGTFIDNCGNYFTQTGASQYTGSGVLIGCASPSSFPVCQLGGATGTASPAECFQSQSGVIAVPASQTTYTVNTNAVTAASQIIVQQTTDNTGISSATCDPGAIAPLISGRTAGTSFTISLNSVAAVTCFQYTIVN